MRRRRFIILSFLYFYIAAMLMAACETETYDTGLGEYSLMQADLCELTVNGQGQGASFVTDDGDAYTLIAPYTAKWIETADTIYRTVIYYNKADASQAELMAISEIPTLRPHEHWKFKELSQDPLGIESAWLSKSGKYLNLGLLIKSGRIDDEEGIHTIGLAQDTLFVHPDGRRTAYYRFLHSQNDIPEYYTNRRYVSILLPSEQRPDTIHLQVQTYEGPLERVFIP
jgi:hypothetical protein